MIKRILCLLLLGVVLGASVSALAQPRAAAPAPAAAEAAKTEAETETKAKTKWGLTEEELTKAFVGSFMFSGAETALVQQALIGRVDKPPPQLETEKKSTKEKKKFNLQKDQVQETLKVEKQVIPERRVIQIAGVLWRGKGDWTVWINGKKVTPKDLLPEIIEIRVENSSYVYLKWYDVGLNKVIAITLRPNQTYDITTGLLLPG